MKNLCKRLYIWKPVSFVTHFFWPAFPIGFSLYACTPIGAAALWVFLKYEFNEPKYLPKDRPFQDIQGVWVALTLPGTVIGILILAEILPACPWLGID